MNNYIADHIENNPDDSSLLLIKNGETRIHLNQQAKRPLASVYKLILVFEYLDQCQQGKIHPDDPIHFRELKRYWIRWIDPAFSRWLKAMKEARKMRRDRIALKEVVVGMLQYSCNTNTDFLLAKLGLDQVNNQLKKYELTDHDDVVPISTSVLASLSESKVDHTPSSVGKLAQEYFRTMLQGKAIKGVDLNLLNHFNLEAQCRWSDLLPHASAETYSKVLRQFQELHPENEQLKEVIDWFGKVKSYQGLSGGLKLGTTPKVFNVAMYATDSSGNRYELIYFLNNLNWDQRQRVELASHDFNRMLLGNPDFIDQLNNKIHANVY